MSIALFVRLLIRIFVECDLISVSHNLFLIIRHDIIPLYLLLFDHEASNEDTKNKDDTCHDIENDLLVLFIIVDALVNENKGGNLANFFTHSVYSRGPAAVMLLDIIVDEWILQDALCNGGSFHTTKSVQCICIINDFRLRYNHTYS